MTDKIRGDLLPRSVARLRSIEGAFLARCREFGYREIRTSTIEPLHIFTATEALTPDLLEKIYSFLDWDSWSGNRVVLRPDCTVSAARYYLEHLREDGGARLCYIENHFVLGGSGLSERWQCGLEHIGGSHPGADAEVLMIATETLRAAGVARPRLVLSWPAVVKAYVEHLMGGGDEASEMLALIKDDEFDAVRERCRGRAELLHLGRMIEERGRNAAYLRNLRPLIGVTPAIRAELDRFVALAETLDAMGMAYEIRFALSRSFEYYTGLQFEVLASGQRKSARDVLAAGGRYDGLIGTLGGLREKIPAVGFAIYLRNAIEHLGGAPDGARVLVGVAKLAPDDVRRARRAVAALTKRGVEAHLTLERLARGKREGYALVVEVGEAGERVLYDARAKEQPLREIVKAAVPAPAAPSRGRKK